MFELDVPGFGMIQLNYLVSDFTGTLSVDGRLIEGVQDRLNKIGEFLEIHFLTADTFGKARDALAGIKGGRLHILTGERHDLQKKAYVNQIGSEKTVALGNGNNDCLMLQAARVGIAVSEGEGCAVKALVAADIQVHSILDGLDLLLHPKRCKATLRF